MPYSLTPQELAIRLGVAALCGFLIGLEREIKHKSLGVRAFVLVCLGSAGFSLTLIEITNFYISTYDDIAMDPTRIIQGIVTGIGFLGGGAILQSQGKVKGAATGASIWVAGGIGVACGYGFYWHAFITTAYAFLILTIFGYCRAKFRDDVKDNIKEEEKPERDEG
ncbi:MgtC/SapB family protein [Sneathiella glossodoripedis]|uniref:MgtC/SapB family protein n=1 Tax=Sneathiella glossodoripedis TaxID=418853 RepID=UPI00046FD0A8|nr:MgtC/SapB family protein [Sneathiella glossodoripedis]